MSFLDWLANLLSRRHHPAPKPQPPILLPDPMASEVLPLVNAVRAKHGKPPLARDANLEAYAGSWAMTMAGMDALVHSSLGKNLSGYREYGQCIAQGQPTAAEAVKGWENHPPHFKIMVGDFDIAGAGFSRGYWCLDVAKV